ncbi:hypothetical protein ACLBWS_17500 [Brucellaceae bacterium D45D]
MGKEIVRVPPDFKHPIDEEGEFIAGAHHELLYHAGPASCTSYQIYENVSEGTPDSPVFGTKRQLVEWLVQEGWDKDMIDFLLENGHSPSWIAQT